MDKLLSPEPGLIIWTIISFLILVFLLKTFAWGPLLGAVEEREEAMRKERERAEAARNEAEKIQADLEKRLAAASEDARALLAQAGKDGEALRAKLKAEAEKEAEALSKKTRAELEEDKRRLVGELRGEVAALSIRAAERLIEKSVDAGVQKTVLEKFFGDLDKEKASN